MLIDYKGSGMNYIKFVVGILVIVLGALILADGVLGLSDVAGESLLTLPQFKLGVGVIAVVLAAAFIEESRK